MRGALRIRVMGKSIRGRASSKVAGQGVVHMRRELPQVLQSDLRIWKLRRDVNRVDNDLEFLLVTIQTLR